jgi:hypothetical protein
LGRVNFYADRWKRAKRPPSPTIVQTRWTVPGILNPSFLSTPTRLALSTLTRLHRHRRAFSIHTRLTLLLPLYANRKHGTWEVGYVMPLNVRAQHGRTQSRYSTEANRATDDEEEDSSSPSSPVTKPIARRSKFDDEEEDSDVRQPIHTPRPCTTPCPAMHKNTQY